MAHLDIGSGTIVANASASERVDFIRKTYLHLGGAMLAFILVETLVIQSGLAFAFTGYPKWIGFCVHQPDSQYANELAHCYGLVYGRFLSC